MGKWKSYIKVNEKKFGVTQMVNPYASIHMGVGGTPINITVALTPRSTFLREMVLEKCAFVQMIYAIKIHHN